jgi:hypothetical protein
MISQYETLNTIAKPDNQRLGHSEQYLRVDFTTFDKTLLKRIFLNILPTGTPTDTL